MLPHAIKVIADTTRSRNERFRFSAAVELCKIAGGFSSKGLEDATALADQDREGERFVTAGMFMQHMLQMSDRYEMPLPPHFVEDLKEFVEKAEELVTRVGTDPEEDAIFKPRPKPID